MAHDLDDTTPLTWSPLTVDELGELSALQDAIDYLDDPLDRHQIADLEAYFHQIGAEPELLTLTGRERGGSMVAWAWNRQLVHDRNPARMWLRGGVHPAWRSQGIGSQLIDWQVRAARSWFARHHRPQDGPLRMIAHAEQRLSAQCDLYRGVKMTARRHFVDMVRDNLENLPEVASVPGVEFRPLTDDLVEECRRAHNVVFADRLESEPVSEAAWAHSLAAESARLDLSRVAIDSTGELVGYAVCSTFDGDDGLTYGWVERLGVCPQWRRRGVATALLAETLHAFAPAGMQRAGIGVDAEGEGTALGVYEGLGYVAAETMIMFARDES